MAFIELPSDFVEFLRLLAEHDVRHVVVGGYAVAHHGYPRATQDLDIAVITSPDNVARLVQVLVAFGFGDDEVTPDLFAPGNMVRIGNPPLRLELLTELSGIDVDRVIARADTAAIAGLRVPVISLADLRRNKQAAGRAQDLADLEALPLPEP